MCILVIRDTGFVVRHCPRALLAISCRDQSRKSGLGCVCCLEPSANPVTEKTGTIVRGCEVVCGTVKSGSKFHARGARTEIQQAILGTDVACGGERTSLLHVIEVLAGYRSGRVIAYRQPNLSAVRLVHIVCGSWTAHLGRHPTWQIGRAHV